MKQLALFLLLLATRSLMAAEPSPPLVIREYRVTGNFIVWLQHEGRPPPNPLGMTICWRMNLGAGSHPWPEGATATYIAAADRLIVKHTAPFLKALDQLAAQWRRNGGKTPPDPRLLEILRKECRPLPEKQ
jgi:hypothetical protein